MKVELSTVFEMKDLGLAIKIFGMEIIHNRQSCRFFVTQYGYIEKVYDRFGMSTAKPVTTPFASHFRLSARDSPHTEDEERYMSRVPYASIVGSIMTRWSALVLIFHRRLV